jgi:hypothetical protein
MADLRSAVENDAYGIYAHVLTRDGCTAEQCAAFGLLRNTTTLKVHLRQGVYATYVARYADRWGLARPSAAAPAAALPEAPAVTTAPSATTAEALLSATGWTATIAPPPMPHARPGAPAVAARTETEAAPVPTRVGGIVPPAASILPNIEFPSASSIPPVSIMTAEPPPPAEAAPAASSTPAPKSSQRAQ